LAAAGVVATSGSDRHTSTIRIRKDLRIGPPSMSVDSGQPQAERCGAARRHHGRGVAQVAPEMITRRAEGSLEDR